MGHERTDVVDQALERYVAAAALFGWIVGGEVFDEVVVVLVGKFDTDAVRLDERSHRERGRYVRWTGHGFVVWKRVQARRVPVARSRV
jgi:hypothetical protein